MPKQRKIDEGKIYRLRNKDTGLFLGYMRESKPTFSKRGKDWKTHKDVLDQLMLYNYNSLRKDLKGGPKGGARKTNKTWPELEIVVFQLMETAVEEDPICDLRQVKKFITATQQHDFSSVARFVKKLAAAGIEFDYVFHAEGSHSLSAIADARVQRNPLTQYNSSAAESHRITGGETIVAVQGDTDMLYVKMQLHESMLGIWDYRKCKAI